MANKFLPKIMGLDSISESLRKLMALGSNSSGLGIPNPTEVADESHRTSLMCSERLVESLIAGWALSKSEHTACLLKISRGRLGSPGCQLGGVVPNPLLSRPLRPEWNAGSMTSLNIFVRTIFRFSKVSRFSFLTFRLFSLVLCSVSVITVAGIL